MRILIAEDDASLADGLTRSLRRAGHAVDWVKNGVDADCAVTTSEFDLLILDLGLPKMNGLDTLKRLRGRGSLVPVLILTALDGVQERVRALDLGADDYLAKPFALEELEARVRALTRRSHGGSSAILRHAQLSYDQAGKVAEINGITVDLSAREMALLEMLRNGDWNYAVFAPDMKMRTGVNQADCLACHKPLDKANYLFSNDPLIAAAKRY